jgi:hypothetical protein
MERARQPADSALGHQGSAQGGSNSSRLGDAVPAARRQAAPVNILLGALVVLGAAAVAIVVMLLVRRHAPEGSYFSDGDRASGVFGVLATGFSVLLGFIIFLAFTSYDQSRAGAETEALIVMQQVETAQLMPRSVRADLTGQLICYARSVVGPEWDHMEDGTQGDAVNPWGVAMFETVRGAEPTSAIEGSAYDKWLDQTSTREEARRDRIHGAEGVVPSPLWIALFAISAIVFIYMLFFADRAERAVTQALLMGSVVVVIGVMLLLLRFLDTPFGSGVGHLQPTAMERALRVSDQALAAIGDTVRPPCDARGEPA